MSAEDSVSAAAPGRLLYRANDTMAQGCAVKLVRTDGSSVQITATEMKKRDVAFDASAERICFRTETGLRTVSLQRAVRDGPVSHSRPVTVRGDDLKAFDVHPKGGLVVSVLEDGSRDEVVLWQKPGWWVDTLAVTRSDSDERMLQVDSSGAVMARMFAYPERDVFTVQRIDPPHQTQGTNLNDLVFTDSAGEVAGTWIRAGLEPPRAVTYSLDRKKASDVVTCGGDRRPILSSGSHALIQRSIGRWMAVARKEHGLCRDPKRWFEQEYGGRSSHESVLYDLRRSPNGDLNTLTIAYEALDAHDLLGYNSTRRYLAFVADVPAEASAPEANPDDAGDDGRFVFDHVTNQARLLATDLHACGDRRPRNVAVWIPSARWTPPARRRNDHAPE